MITDERIEQLLRDAFRAHEHLADQAVAHGAVPHRRRKVVAAVAAAAAVVAAGTVGGGVWLGHRDGSLGIVEVPRGGVPLDPAPTHGRVLRTDAENRVGTLRLVERAMSSGGRAIRALPGGVEPATAKEIPGLAQQNVSLGGGNQVLRSSFFLADDPDTKALADYVAAHPPASFTTDGYEPGEPHAGVGGSINLDGTWSDEVIWDGPDLGLDAPGGVSLLVQLTATAGRTGIRLTAFGTWFPARPAASYLDEEVTSVDVTYRRGGMHPAARGLRVTMADPQAIERVVTAYNRLLGWPESFHSCPYLGRPDRLVAVFHTANRDVSLRWAEGCYGIWEVRVDGRRVPPYLTDALGLRARLISWARMVDAL